MEDCFPQYMQYKQLYSVGGDDILEDGDRTVSEYEALDGDKEANVEAQNQIVQSSLDVTDSKLLTG